MKRIKQFFTLLACMALIHSVACADELYFEGTGLQEPAVQLFMETHPEVTVQTSPHTAYYSTTQLVRQLVSLDFFT